MKPPKRLTLGKLYNIISIGTLSSIYIIFLIVYSMAFLHPSGQVIFDINYFHEKHGEVVLLIVTAPSIYRYLRKLLDDE